MNSLICQNYANALKDLALENDKLIKYREDINTIINLFDENNDLLTFINHPNILKEDKKNLAKEIFDVDKIILNFIMVLIDKSYIQYLHGIAFDFNKLVNIELNVKEIECYSASVLSDDQKAKLEAMLEKKYQTGIVINYLIDESLLAGIKLYVDGQVIDNSAVSKLAKLKEEVENIALKIEV